jgi:flagellar FliL protein
MADRPVDPRNPRKESPERVERKEEPAAAEASPAPAPKPAISLKPWLPLLVTVAVMPALAFATTRFVLIPRMKQALSQPGAVAAAATGAKAEAGAGALDSKPKVTVPLSKILVNVAGTMGTRYLMTSVTLVGADDTMRAKVEQNRDELLDLATGTLSTKSISDLEKPGARNVIRAELLTVFNNALGGSLIKEIYITELAIQ